MIQLALIGAMNAISRKKRLIGRMGRPFWFVILVFGYFLLPMLCNADSSSYRTAYFGSSLNQAAGYLVMLKKCDDGWRLMRVELSGNIHKGPLVQRATEPLALSDCIVVPRVDGKVEIYDETLELAWSFEVKPERNIGPGTRMASGNAIALLTVSAAEQRKFIEIYTIDMDLNKAQLIEEREIDQVGGLVQYAGNLWLIGKEKAVQLTRSEATN